MKYRIKLTVRSEIYKNFPRVKSSVANLEWRIDYLKTEIENLENKIKNLEDKIKM
jgi:archaellum component FlaC